MPKSVLFEASDLTSSSGTGIATYARNLASVARTIGYQPDGLFTVARRLDRRNPYLNEILAFDTAPDNDTYNVFTTVLQTLLSPFAALGGVEPVKIVQTGMVVGPTVEAMRVFRDAYAVTRLGDLSKSHFEIYGRRAVAKLPSPPTIFHATSVIPVAVKGCPNVYTIHDLVPLRLPYTTTHKKKYFYNLLKHLASKADHIVTVSEHSKRDIVEFLGISEKRVTNTYQSVSFPEDLLNRTDDNIAQDLEDRFQLAFGEYYLFYGALEPKKNVSRIVDAYATSGSIRDLIIAGSAGWQNSADTSRIADKRFSSLRIRGDTIRQNRQVRRIGYLPLDQLVSLIRGARGVIFPSIYEGFGLPVIEAMLLGVPVITSSAASLPEIAGDAAIIVDPYDTSALRDAIKTLDNDTDLCEALTIRGREQAKLFSPDIYQQRVAGLYKKIIG